MIHIPHCLLYCKYISVIERLVKSEYHVLHSASMSTDEQAFYCCTLYNDFLQN